VSASASYVVTAQNSGGQSTVSLTIAVNAGPLLTLGHQSGIAATRATATRVLSVEFGLPQHWILWDYAAASVIATGTAGCGPTGSCPQNLIDMAGSTAVIVGPTGFEIRAASDGQVLGNISKPFVVNWMLATDGSYIATWGGTDLSAWSTSGQLLFSKSGNYGGASVFAAPNELRVAWGPAGQSVVETIAVPGGASTTGPQFNGLFSSWFTDGTRFITLAGSTALIYSKDGVQLGSIASVPAAATLVGQGNWVLVNPNYNPPITIYPAAGVTPAPAATYNLGAPVVALASGMTIGVLHENSSVMNVIDLSGAAPVKADYTAPVRLNGQPGTAPPYAAASASQWVVGNPDGVLLDGASLAGTPRYFGFGRAWSIAGGTGHFAIATALRTILYFNSGTLAMEGQIAFPASELTMSADGTLLAAQGASDAYGVYPVQVYNLPAASLQYTWPYTYSSASGGVIPRDIILSASGNVLGQVLNTLPAGTITLQASAPTGGSTIFSIPVSSPSDIRYWPAIRITPDGTLVAAQTVAASGQMPAANLLQNGTLVTAFSGLPGGWLDNSRLLVNNYTATPDALILYSGCSIYGPNGSPTSAACALPEEVRRLQPLTSDTIFIPATNQIRVVSTGALSWMSGDAFEWQQSPQAAVAGSTVIFVSGIDLLAQSF
jgi:hypothetical protein